MHAPRTTVKKESGFSLIELLIVVAILGLVGIIAVPSISNTFRFSVKSSARELATLIKDASNSAQVTGKIHRVVYDLKNQKYWVEASSEATLMTSEEAKLHEKEYPKSLFRTAEEEEEEAKKKNAGFMMAKTLTAKKRSFPLGVYIKDVLTEQSESVITEGLAYTHIFPHGVTERTLIHLSDTAKNDVTLIVSNLLGRCAIEGRYMDAKEAFK